MPCSVSREEELWYETNGNFEKYGKKVTNLQLTNAVACELADILRKHNLINSLSKMSQRWVMNHEESDRQIAKRARSEEERTRMKKAALNKLSEEDRKILGL